MNRKSNRNLIKKNLTKMKNILPMIPILILVAIPQVLMKWKKWKQKTLQKISKKFSHTLMNNAPKTMKYPSMKTSTVTDLNASLQ